MPSLKRRRRGLVLIVSAMAAGLALLTLDDHRTNAKYLLWRDTAIGDWKREMRFLNVDVRFHRSFIGQPRMELLRWFPDLRPGTSRPDPCPNTEDYALWREKRRAGEWIGTSPWLVTYDKNEAVQELLLIGGC
jgi:hypothetical protein